MDEALKEKALQALSELLDLALQAKDFAVEQAPDVVRQLLAWNLAYSLLQFALCAFGLSVPLLAARWLWKRRPIPDNYSTGEEDAAGTNPRDREWINRGIAFMLCAVATFAALVMLSETEWVWLKILVAPKLYLIEYAAALVK